MKAQRLRQWADENGFSYIGAYRAFKRGDIPNAYALPSGTILVGSAPQKEEVASKTAIYARVSSPKQKPDLETQAARISAFCFANGWVVDSVYKEIASGLNDDRKVLNKILDDASITRVVVEHKDRLSRFGFNYIERLLKQTNREIVVINRADTNKEDLMQDFVSVITSMTARLYGLRRSTRRTEQIIKNLSAPDASDRS